MTIATSNPFSITLTSGNAPAWFTAQNDGEWLNISTGAGENVSDLTPVPEPDAGGTGGPVTIGTAWTGAGVDPATRNYFLIANGGHNDYAGNEGYAIDLGQDSPRFRRLTDPTPNATMGNTGTGPEAATHTDGRPRAMHNGNQVFAAGRIWFPIMNSVTSGGGGNVNERVSFDPFFPGVPQSAGAPPLPYTAANIGPWELHGIGFDGGGQGFGFGYGVWDSTGERVHAFANGFGGAGTVVKWDFSVASADYGQDLVGFNYGIGWNCKPTWVTICEDLRIIVMGNSLDTADAFGITVYNIDTDSFSQAASITGPGAIGGSGGRGASGVYIQENNSIAVCDPNSLPQISSSGNDWTFEPYFSKLQIPTSGGNYDPGGQWVWSEVQPGGDKFSFRTTNGQASGLGNREGFSRFNIIPDMGNGQAAIVFLSSIYAGVNVYKVPPGGL